MELTYYKDFEEKREIFNHIIVDDFCSFQRTVEEFKPREYTRRLFGGRPISVTKSFLFRGVKNSTFKIYSSIHRCLADRINKYGCKISLYSLLGEILHRFQSDNGGNLFCEYKRQCEGKTVSTEPSMWAFIQHFGGPSPLVDFSSELESALFFAFCGHTAPVPGEIMSQYVSLYIYPDNPMRTGEIASMYAHDGERATESVIETEKTLNTVVDTDKVCVELAEQRLDPVLWGTMVYGGEKSIQSYRIPDADNTVVQAAAINNNIIAQAGNFFLGNLQHPIPLEMSDVLRTSYIDGNGQKCYRKYGTCIEINKNIIGEIIDNFNIPTESEIYPDKSQLEHIYAQMAQLWAPSR